MTYLPDDTDRILLGALQKDARTPLDRLAEVCGQSVPTVQRRLKRLRETGVIQAEVAILSPAKMGYGMLFIVSVELEREALHQLDAFRRQAKADAQVQQCYYATGEADFILICTARDMSDFEALTHRLFFDDSNVRRFRTSVVMDATKTGLTVPCDPM